MTADDDGAAVADLGTGIRGQRLILEGWFASHADGGSPGPHVHLRTSDGREAVVRTDQIQELIAALTRVAQRIERLWDIDGEEYTETVLRHSPDPNDPAWIRDNRIRYMELTDLIAANLPEVARLLLEAGSTDEALTSVAALLGVDEADVMLRLADFDLLSMTRAAAERRVSLLAQLRRE